MERGPQFQAPHAQADLRGFPVLFVPLLPNPRSQPSLSPATCCFPLSPPVPLKAASSQLLCLVLESPGLFLSPPAVAPPSLVHLLERCAWGHPNPFNDSYSFSTCLAFSLLSEYPTCHHNELASVSLCPWLCDSVSVSVYLCLFPGMSVCIALCIGSTIHAFFPPRFGYFSALLAVPRTLLAYEVGLGVLCT